MNAVRVVLFNALRCAFIPKNVLSALHYFTTVANFESSSSLCILINKIIEKGLSNRAYILSYFWLTVSHTSYRMSSNNSHSNNTKNFRGRIIIYILVFVGFTVYLYSKIRSQGATLKCLRSWF